MLRAEIFSIFRSGGKADPPLKGRGGAVSGPVRRRFIFPGEVFSIFREDSQSKLHLHGFLYTNDREKLAKVRIVASYPQFPGHSTCQLSCPAMGAMSICSLTFTLIHSYWAWHGFWSRGAMLKGKFTDIVRHSSKSGP